jgi:ribonuclease Z
MANKIKITFLGTSASIPTVNRNHTSIILNYKEDNILIDCGEGTQRQFRKAKLNPCKVNKLLITHWHGDHVLGLPGFFQTLALSDYNREMQIFGPKKTKEFMRNFVGIFVPVFKFKADVNEINKEGIFYEMKNII